MTTPAKTNPLPNRGEVWWINFDPSIGAEQRKTRPAVVINVAAVGKLPLRIVIPITGWNPKYLTIPWLVYLKSSQRNGLKKDSAADCFQVKSLSLDRFESLMGVLTADEIEQISAAVALCVGAS